MNDYNVLMKDLPLNELMAATDMDGIKNALAAIFTHMRKLRNTKYPIARALRFIEAISKDVFTQMLKVCGISFFHFAFHESTTSNTALIYILTVFFRV